MHRLVLVFMLALVALAIFAPSAFAQAADVTTRSCAFSSGFFDGLSRFIYGIALVLFGIAVIMGLRNVHTEGAWGPVIAVAGVGLALALLGNLTALTPVALAAAGAPACS